MRQIAVKYEGAIILSGEGETGTFERHTGKPTMLAINRRLARERCGGDRWARAFVPAGQGYDDDTYVDINSGDFRTIDEDDIS